MNPSRATGVQHQSRATAPSNVENPVSKWPRMILMSAATSTWLIYDMATATEAPRQAVAILQYCLLACALIGLAGSLVMLASQK
jgi:hypothetical protein